MKGEFKNCVLISMFQKSCKLFPGCWEDSQVSPVLKGGHSITESTVHYLKIIVVGTISSSF